ncbi:phosphotransferase [Gemella sp. GH3]|uniref:phosphotransferase n=1 Tax=unclassified Gemella TaxID=2624949 RepID=UPI0015D0572C|nr:MULTISPECIES: phosphotransferase [unclassified Gemella]MBF0714316.1 phosphotransferase [Gemella sp. GH3.1]NYS51268.1 phosphotransferase [Gemella sp. GH3]
MNIKNKIENILKEEVIDIKKTSYGITNVNYIITTNEHKYFCRIPKDNLLLSKKDNELEALNTLKNKSYFLKPIYYSQNLLITPFQQNAKTFISNKNLSTIVEIANILKDFHSSEYIVDSEFNPTKKFKQYFEQIENKNNYIDKYIYLLDEFEKFYEPDRLCHNDLVEGNFLFVKNKIYLIDFEYCGLNDHYFDIASFISENNLNYQETITFLKNYFSEEACNFEKLDIFLKFADLLWYTWALLLYEKRGEEVYKTIFEEKLNSLKYPRKIKY